MRRYWHRIFGHPAYVIADAGNGYLRPRCIKCKQFFGLRYRGRYSIGTQANQNRN